MAAQDSFSLSKRGQFSRQGPKLAVESCKTLGSEDGVPVTLFFVAYFHLLRSAISRPRGISSDFSLQLRDFHSRNAHNQHSANFHSFQWNNVEISRSFIRKVFRRLAKRPAHLHNQCSAKRIWFATCGPFKMCSTFSTTSWVSRRVHDPPVSTLISGKNLFDSK